MPAEKKRRPAGPRTGEAEAIATCLRAQGHPIAVSALIDAYRLAQAEGHPAPWIEAMRRYGFAAQIADDVRADQLAAELYPCVLLAPGRPVAIARPPRQPVNACLLFLRPRLDQEAGSLPTSWGALLADWRPTVLRAGLAGLLANLLALAAPIFSAQVYDRVLPHGLLDSLATMAGLFLAAALFEQVFRRLRTLFVEEALHAGTIRLSVDMHRRVLATRFEGTAPPSGHLMRLLQDYDSLRDGFGAAAVSLLADLPFLALFLAGMVLCDPLIAGAVVLVTFGLGLATLLAIRRQRLLHRACSQAATARAQAAQEAFLDPEAARRVGAATYLQGRFAHATALYAAAARAIRGVAATRSNLSLLAQNLATLLAIGIGAWHAVETGMTAGLVLAATMLATRFTGAAMQILAVVPQGLAALAALESLRTVTARPTERPAGTAPIHRPLANGHLTVEAVTARYPGQAQPALSEISLHVAASQRLAVIGPSGSGKSTLEKVISGVIRPERGRVLLDGIDLTAIEPTDLRRHLAICPQNPVLYAGSLRANLDFNGELEDDTILAMLAALGGEQVLPVGMGLDFEVAEGGRNLSGGQRQLIAVARSLLRGAAITLLDEPSSGLDEVSEQRMIAGIDQTCVGRTLIVISHRPTVLTLAPRLAVMGRGRVLRLANTAELITAGGRR